MKFNVFLAALTGLTAAAACGSDTATTAGTAAGRVLVANDFENLAGWGIDPALLARDHAHSGVCAISVDPGHEFSLTYENALGQLSAQKLRKVHLSAWVYLRGPAGGGGVLALQITDPAQGYKAIGNDGINLGEAVNEYNQWVAVSKDVVLPETATSDSHLKVFLWRAGATQAVFADDLRLTALD